MAIFNKIFLRYKNAFCGISFLFLLFFSTQGFAQGGPGPHAHGSAERPIFAHVGDNIIYLDEYSMFLQSEIRGKFYHGKPPEAELAPFQREIGQKLVDNLLRLLEAKKLGLAPDSEAIEKQIDGYEKRYANSEQWKSRRDELLPRLRKKLEDDSLLKALEEKIRKSSDPSDADVMAFYKANPDKFTEPARVKVSVILLKVEPSSPSEVWGAALEEGKDILARLKSGADFGDLARIHSGDESASRGGDMGYLHGGMLDQALQAALDELKVGGLTDAIRILQGIVILRLDDRTESKLVSLETANERAKGLLQRELADKAWADLTVRLRTETKISVNESYYLPLPEKTTANDAGPSQSVK